jgi:hypothetical protein
MGLFGSGGLKSFGNSVAATIAQLVGQDIVAKTLTATSTTAADWVLPSGGTANFSGSNKLAGAAGAGTAVYSNPSGALDFYSNTSLVAQMLGGGSFWVFNFGVNVAGVGMQLASRLLMSVTAPTIVAGAGASVVSNNGSAVFEINLGAAASTGTITLPSATTGWVVYMQNITHPDANVLGQTGSTQTTATFTNYVRTTGVAGNWSANDHMLCIALAY